MAITKNKRNLKDLIREFIELLLKSMNKRKKTWHMHVVPYEDDWAVRREGNKRVTSRHRKQSTAINKAKIIARKHKSDVIIHGTDGRIRDRISFD